MCVRQSWCCQLKDERNCVLCVLDWFLSTFQCVCMKKGEEVETKVNVSDAFLFSQRPRSLVAFQVGLPNRDRKSCFWISYKKVQRWKMSRFQETNTLMHLCLALGRLAIKFSYSTSFWSWSPQTRAQSSLPSWLPPSSLLPCWRPAMVTAVKTWVRCSVSCPGGGTWPFSIQDYGLDYNEKWKLQLYW